MNPTRQPPASKPASSSAQHAHASSASGSQQRKGSSSSEASSSSSQVTTVSATRPTPYIHQNARATQSTTSVASSHRTTSKGLSDLPFRQPLNHHHSSKLRQHSQGLFDPSLPSHGNLTASAIAAQAAMHNQAPLHNRRQSQNIVETSSIRPVAGRKPSAPAPINTGVTATSPPSDSQSRSNSIVDSRSAALAAFPRSPSASPNLTRNDSPVSFFDQQQKPQKKESRMKLFSKPRHIHLSKDKDGERKALASPKSLYSLNSSSKVNQSVASLADTSGTSSLYASTNTSTATLTPTDKSTAVDKDKHRHNFLSRQKNKIRDNLDHHHHFPLSSASSNSRPVDPSAPQPLYSFAPSSPGPGSKSISGLDLRHVGRAIREKRKEEKASAASGFVPPLSSSTINLDAIRHRQESNADLQDANSTFFGPASASTFTSQVSTELGLPNPGLGTFGLQGMGADDAWPLLKARLLNIFEGEDLRTPVEDFNTLLSIHLQACIQRRAPGIVMEDLRDLLSTGFRSLDQTLRVVPDERLVSRLVDMWSFVFGTVLPFMQAVFLPLDLEFKGAGPIMSPKDATEFWKNLSSAGHRPSIATITPANPNGTPRPFVLDVRTMVLQSFRDEVIIPRHTTLLAIFSRLSLDSIHAAAADSQASDRPGTASSGSASGYSSAMPGNFDPSSYNSTGSTLLDSGGTGSLGARSRATSNTSAGSFHSIGSSRPSAGQHRGQIGQGLSQRYAQSTIHLRTPAPATSLPVVDSARVTQTAARMLQCLSVLAGLNAGDLPPPASTSSGKSNVSASATSSSSAANRDDDHDDEGNIPDDPETASRKMMEQLANQLKLNWLGRARTGRNRRGLVGTKIVPGLGVGVGVAA